MNGWRLSAAAALLSTVAGCGVAAEPAVADGLGGELTVFAAASLKEAFGQIETELEADYPDLAITVQYGGSGQLAAQIRQGAPADVFASADEATMAALSDAGLVAGSETFATNRLQIAVPTGNPGGVASLSDLADDDLTVVTCAEAAACGKTELKIQQQTGIQIASDSKEPDVKSVLQKVAMGEADAGLVYVTDVLAQPDKVEGIDFPESAGFANAYPIGVVDPTPHREAAEAFVAYVRGAGQQALAQAGFGAIP